MPGPAKKSAFLLSATLSIAALALSACSPSMFGSGVDQSVQKQPSYQKINSSCANIDLSSNRFDVKSFRALVNCFNSEGAVPEFADFVNRTAPSELEPLIELVNANLLGDPQILYGIEKTFADLGKSGQLDATIRDLSALLGHDDLIASSLSLWRARSWLGDVTDRLGLTSAPTRTELLKSLEILAAEWDAPSAGRLIDTAQWMVSGKSFGELATRLSAPGAIGLGEAMPALTQYLTAARDGDGARVLKQAIEVTWTGELVRSLDPIVGADPARMKSQVPKLGSLFDSLFADRGKLAHELGGLIQALQAPVACLKGAKSVEKPTMLVLSDLAGLTAATDQQLADRAAEYLVRTDPLRLMALSPLCSFPAGLNEHLAKSHELLVASPALVPLVETLRGLYAQGRDGRYPMVEFFVDVMADARFDELLPAFSGLSERAVWNDLVLVANRVPLEARGAADRKSYAYLTEPRAELGDRSVSQILAASLAQLDLGQVMGFARAGLGLIEKSGSDLVPAVAAMQGLYRANDTRPFFGLLRNISARATAQEALFNSLEKLAADSREFRAVFRSLPRLAQGGQLKDILGSLITLLHKHASEGRPPETSTTLAAALPPRHDLSATELAAFRAPTVHEPGDLLGKCGGFDFGFSLDQYASPQFRKQMDLYVACLQAGDASALSTETAASIQYLLTDRAEDGRSLYGYAVDLLHAWGDHLEKAQLAWFLDAWSRQYDEGRFQEILSASHAWIAEPYAGGPVLRPLIDALAQGYAQARPAFARIEKAAGRVLKRDELPAALAYVDDLSGAKPGPVATANPRPRFNTDSARTMQWIRNKECAGLFGGQTTLEGRAEQLFDEYRNAVASADAMGGQPRRQWSIPELQGLAEPLFKKLAEPSAIAGQTHVIDALVKSMGYFSLGEGQAVDRDRHYTPEYLEKWLRDRSNDYRRITYFYPGDDRPRVRIVNSLDRLEMLVVNANVSGPFFPVDKNNALYYLALIAEAWGDEDPSVWPPEIQQQYNETGNYPPKLADVVARMWKDEWDFESVIGFPAVPGCLIRNTNDPEDIEIPDHGTIPPIPIPGFDPRPLQIALYNLRQVLSVLGENVPGSGTQFDGGLKVLRDLFFQIYYSTSPDDRNPRAGDRNNLSAVTRMCQLGVIRQLGRVMRETPENDPATREFYLSFLKTAQSPEVLGLLGPLLADDSEHALLWKLIERIFGQLDASPEARERVKQIGFYGLLNARQLGVTDGLLKNLGVAVHEHRDFLVKHADLVDDLLRSESVRSFLRAYFADAAGSAPKLKLRAITDDALAGSRLTSDILGALEPLAASPNWDVFKARKAALDASPEYQALRFDQLRRDFLDVVEERSTDPQAILFGRRTRLAVADRLEAGQLDILLLAASRNPDGFYHLLDTLAQGSGTQAAPGPLMDFFGFIRRGLAQ